MFLAAPRMLRLLRYRIQPSLGSLIRLFTIGHEYEFEGLKPLHDSNYILAYEQQQRYSSWKTLRFPDARPFGLCDQIPTRGVHPRDVGPPAQHLHQRLLRLRGATGGVRRGRRPCSSVGELPAQGLRLGAREQFEGCVQQDDSPEKLPQHPQEVVGRRSVVAKLFCSKLRRRADCRYSPVHRAATDTSIGPKNAFGVRAILPRPEGRGLPRSWIK